MHTDLYDYVFFSGMIYFYHKLLVYLPTMLLDYLTTTAHWDLALASSLPKMCCGDVAAVQRRFSALVCPTLSPLHLSTLLKQITLQSSNIHANMAERHVTDREPDEWSQCKSVQPCRVI